MMTSHQRRILDAMDSAMRIGDATAYNGLSRFLKIQAVRDSDDHCDAAFGKA